MKSTTKITKDQAKTNLREIADRIEGELINDKIIYLTVVDFNYPRIDVIFFRKTSVHLDEMNRIKSVVEGELKRLGILNPKMEYFVSPEKYEGYRSLSLVVGFQFVYRFKADEPDFVFIDTE